MRFFLLRMALIAAAIYLLVAVFLYVFQQRLLFPAPTTYVPPSAVGVPEMAEIAFGAADDGLWATAWWVAPSSPDGEIVMVFHGNGSAVYSNYDIFRDMIDAGHGVWSVGYPGYPRHVEGQSKPSEPGIVASARDQRAYLGALNVDGRPINYYGTSIGSGVAAQLTRTHPPERLFLDAPFNSLLDMTKRGFPMFPHGVLLKHPFRSDLALQAYDGPLYWSHGTLDRIVPIGEGRRLYESYDGPKRSKVIDGANHVNTWPMGARDFVLETLSEDDAEDQASTSL